MPASPKKIPTMDRAPVEEITSNELYQRWLGNLVDIFNTAMQVINERLVSGGL